MKKESISGQLALVLFLIFMTPCFGQTADYMFHGAIRDKAGNLWFATTGAGVYRYEVASDKFTNFTVRDGLPSNKVSAVFEDKSGTLWFNTENGVCRFTSGTFTDFSTKESRWNSDVNCIYEDKSGTFWFGTNGYGVSRYNPVTNTFTNFTKEHGLGSNAVQCVLEDKAGNLWFGERAGGVSRFDTSTSRFTKVNGGCLSSQIMSILEDKSGDIWFVNLYNGLCRYISASLRTGTSATLSTGTSATLSTGPAGTPSAGTLGKFTHFSVANGLCNDTLTCIYEDKKGNFWLGSDRGKYNNGSGGVCRFNPATGESTRFTEKEGLRNIDVWTVVEDNDGGIWVGTRGGLFRYHAPSGRFIDYTHKVNRQ